MGAIAQVIELAIDTAGRAAVAPAVALSKAGLPDAAAVAGGAAITGGVLYGGVRALDAATGVDQRRQERAQLPPTPTPAPRPPAASPSSSSVRGWPVDMEWLINGGNKP